MNGYQYSDFQEYLYSFEGTKAWLRVYHHALELNKAAGVMRWDKLARATGVMDTWNQLAVIDHLVPLGLLTEIDQTRECATQDRLYELGPDVPNHLR